MSSDWFPLFWLAASFLILFLLRRWIGARVQAISYLLSGDLTVTMWLYFVAFLPGVVVHELSHWLMALILGVPRGKVRLWPERKSGGVRLGSVMVKPVDPLRNSLVGLAPLLGGTAVVLLIGDWVLRLGEVGEALLGGRWEGLWRAVERSVHIPDFWLWLYFLFTVANAMMPSESDREPWPPVLIFLVLVSLLSIASGQIPRVAPELAGGVVAALSFLAYAFTLAVGVDLVFGAVLWPLEQALVVWRRSGKV
jgi:hypothetical protein